jgi:hypothetical protein
MHSPAEAVPQVKFADVGQTLTFADKLLEAVVQFVAHDSLTCSQNVLDIAQAVRKTGRQSAAALAEGVRSSNPRAPTNYPVRPPSMGLPKPHPGETSGFDCHMEEVGLYVACRQSIQTAARPGMSERFPTPPNVHRRIRDA